MSRYGKIVRLVRRALGLPPIVEDLFEITAKVLDPEPVEKGVPLTYRDVEHQRAQMKSATKRPPLAPVPSSTPDVRGKSKGRPR